MGIFEDFADFMNFGKKVEAHGKEWLLVGSAMGEGFFYAVAKHPEKENTAIMPAPVHLIYIKPKEKKPEEKPSDGQRSTPNAG